MEKGSIDHFPANPNPLGNLLDCSIDTHHKWPGGVDNNNSVHQNNLVTELWRGDQNSFEHISRTDINSSMVQDFDQQSMQAGQPLLLNLTNELNQVPSVQQQQQQLQQLQ